MFTRNWKRIVAMMLACVMMYTMLPMGVFAEEPAAADEQEVATMEVPELPAEASTDILVEDSMAVMPDESDVDPDVAIAVDPETEADEPAVETSAEEPVAEPTEAEKLIAKIDNMLLRYLGDQFRDGVRTNEEILAEVNQLSGSEIAAIVNGYADNRFERLVAEVKSMKDAIAELLADDRAACNSRGVFAALCSAMEARKNSAESAALIEARETILSVNAYCGNADVMAMGPEELQSIISAINTMIMRVEYLDAVDRPAVEEQYGATIDALCEVLYAAEARLTEIDALTAFYAEMELFGMKYNVMAEPEILAEGMQYWELLDCKAEIKALENTINSLNPMDAVQFGHLMTFMADLKDAVQVRLDDLGPKLHSDSLRRDLLPLLEEAKELYCLPYTEEDLWIKLETKVALIAQSEDPSAAFTAIEKILGIYDQLIEKHKAMIDEEYGAEVVFLTELYADLVELAGTPNAMVAQSSWLDTSVSGEYFKIINENHYNLIPGAQEAELILNNADGSDRKVVHVMAIDTKNENVSIVPGYYGLDPKNPESILERANQGKAGVSTMAKYYETLGYDVIGGMNTSLAYDCDAPYTFMVYNGQVLQRYSSGTDELDQHSGRCETYLAVYKDGTCELRSYSTPLDGNEWQAISSNFGWVVKNGELVSKTVERTSSDAARSLIGIKADGTLVLCMVDGRNANNSTGLSNYELGEMMLSLGCMNAVNCDGGGSSSFITQREGESNFSIRCVPCDGAERETIHSIFVVSNVKGPSGDFDHVNVTSDYTYYAPYTTSEFAVQAIDTNGYDIAVPSDAVWALSDASFGTIENGIFTSNGKLGEVDVQMVQNDNVVGSKTIQVVNPKVARFASAETASPYGKTITLELVVRAEVIAEDQEKNYAGDYDVFFQLDNFDFVLSASNAGTLNGLELTAPAEDSGVRSLTITATYKHADLGSSSVKVNYGKETEVKWDFEDGDISNWLGITEAIAWCKANVPNSPLISYHGNSADGKIYAGNFSDDSTSRTFLASAENGQVKTGNYALGVEIDLSTASFGTWCYNMFFNVEGQTVLRDTANGQNATVLGMWVYIPEGAPGLAMQTQLYQGTSAETATSYGSNVSFVFPTGVKTLNAATEADVPDSRWVFGYVPLTANYVSLQNPHNNIWREPSFIRFYTQGTEAKNLTFYYDDISLDYSSVVPDRDKPVISDFGYVPNDEVLVLTNGQEITVTSAGFSANIADFVAANAVGLNLTTAKIYLDGVELESAVTGAILATQQNAALSVGTHTVTFEVADKAGNFAQENVTFTVKGEGNAVVYLGGHNDKGNTPEYDSIYFADLRTDKVEDIQKVEARIMLNTANTWELDHLIVDPAFKVVSAEAQDDGREYNLGVAARGADIHAMDNVVKVVLEKIDSTRTGECTIVSLPVRVWSWDEEKSGVTAEDQFKTGYCPVVTIDYDVLVGNVETAQGTVLTFNGSASVATMLNDNINPWHKHIATPVADKPVNCFENGYTGRTYCDECGSVVDWGTVIVAEGHDYVVNGNALICKTEDCGEQLKATGVVTVGEDKYYLLAGTLMTGWQSFGAEGYCYADPITKKVYADCTFKVDSLTYSADETGLMLGGAWYEDFLGRRYSYGPGFYSRVWATIDGEEYYFAEKTGYAYTGYQTITDNRNDPNAALRWYHFAEDGKLIERMTYTGVVDTGNGFYYMENGVATYAGLVKVDDDYYCAEDKYGKVMTGKQWVGTYLVSISKDPLATGYYEFGEDGKMLQGVVKKPDGTYYYQFGNVYDAGWVNHDGDYYVFTNGGKALTGTHWVGTYLTEHSVNPYKAGNFVFDAEGKLANGVVYIDGIGYYCEQGVMVEAGLILINGDYYYSGEKGVLSTGRIWVGTYASHGWIERGYYEFGADGKMLDGVVEKADGVYYYKQGQLCDTGWLKLHDDYFVFTDGGKALTGEHWVGSYLTAHSVNPYKVGNFMFADDGKLANGILEHDDGLYYYQNGVTQYLGFIEDNGKCYYVNEGGKLEVGNVWVGTYASNGKIDKGYYEFTTTGELANGIIEKEDGLYFYKKGLASYLGLIEHNGEYYYVCTDGKIETGRVYVGTYDAHGIVKNGTYEFNDDGTMRNGFEKLSDGLYYYNMGVAQYYGLKIIGSDLYYIDEGGKVVTGTVWVGTSASNGLLQKGNYTFDAEGKLIK